MTPLSSFIAESIKRPSIRIEAIEDWRAKYRGGKFWESYLKSNPKVITSICAALVGKKVDNWNGWKGVISDFVTMFFCGYLGKTQEPFVKVKDISINKEDGKRTCTCIAYDKWNGGEVAQFNIELNMGDEKTIRAYKAGNFDKISTRKLKVTMDVAKYKNDDDYVWKHITTPIIKINIPPINDENRKQFHDEVIKQMLDAAHYVNWGVIDPINKNVEQ